MHAIKCVVLSLWFMAAVPSAVFAAPSPAEGLDSVVNFRDLGGKITRDGLCVRRQRVFRSGNYDHTSAADAGALVERTALRDYYDLRATGEAQGGLGPAVLADLGVRYHGLPMDSHDDPMLKVAQPTPTQWTDFYLRTLTRHGGTFIALMETLSRDDAAAVYGCSLGKDRTGMATALLLGALGVDDDTVVADYAASSAGLAAHVDAMRAAYEYLGISRDDYARFWMTAHASTMREFLDNVRQTYGGVVPALRALGMSQHLLDAWRARMLSTSLVDCQ